MLIDLAINLLAAFIGFSFARGYSYISQVLSRRASKSFWIPIPSTKIYLFHGTWAGILTDLGEREQVVNLQDALTLGQLRVFLELYYPEVIVVQDINLIDWQFPVVSIGGPLPNSLAKEIGGKGLIPIWFLDLPYSEQSERVIGSIGRIEVFRSEFNQSRQLVSDVGFVARIKSPENEQQFLYIIAANYGIGSLGIIKHLSSVKKLSQLHKMGKDRYFQAVIRSRILDNKIIHTKLVHYESIG